MGMSDAEVFGGGGAGQSNAPMSDADVFGSAAASAQPTRQPANRNWSDIPDEMATNFLPSAGKFASGAYQMARHPIDTATNMLDVAQGEVQKGLRNVLPQSVINAADALPQSAALTQSGQRADRAAGATNKYFGNRYGSIEALKNTLATDPVGAAADFASVLTGGEAMAERAPGIVGRAAETAGTLGRNINPVNLPTNLANAGIRGVNNGVNAVRRMSTPVSPEAEATNYVSGLMQSANRTPQDLAAHPAVTQGKPISTAEAIGRPGITGLRALGLRQGQTGDTLSAMLAERAEGVPGRVMTDFHQATGIDPSAALGDIQQVVKDGREKAVPLYAKANDTGSTAPLKSVFEKHIADLDAFHNDAIGAANDKVAQAQNALNGANGKINFAQKVVWDRPGANVSPGAWGLREKAQADLDAANAELSHATHAAQKASIGRAGLSARLAQAQDDAVAGLKGGIWSPRIQQFLDDPILKRGIGQGLEIERLESLEKGVPFNPKDYAVTGADEDGNPIIGGVPNMRVLDAGKRGLDQIISEQPKTVAGQLDMSNYRTQRLIGVKNAYLKELDDLNPDYKAARLRASDYLSARDAFDTAQKMFSNPNVTAKQFADVFAKHEGANAEAFKGGPANWLFNQAQQGKLSGRTFNRPILQQKLATVIGDPAKASAFLDKMKTESDLAKSGARMAPGVNSTTFESDEAAKDQDHVGAIGDAAGAIGKLLTGHPGAAFKKAASAVGKTGAFIRTPGMSVPTRDAAGRLLMMPAAEGAAQMSLTPPPIPAPRMRGLIPQGARTGTLGAYQAGNLTSQAPYRRGGFVR